ncbi:MAG: PDZ domain-containing protein [Fibrobacter sp.]|nr:PDZ domain-containing protein [Fibrobacter sp.]
MIQKIPSLIFCAATAAYFLACSSDTLSSADDSSDGASDELKQTYSLLEGYYYLADKELSTLSSYVDTPYKVYIPDKFADDADVLGMFYVMSDKLTRYYPSSLYNTVYTALNESDHENKSFGMELDSNLVVKYVYREGPANSAGINRRDTVATVNGNTFQSLKDFNAYLSSVDSTDTFEFTVRHGKSTMDVSMTRTTLNLPTVYVDTVQGIPLIRITDFTNVTNGFEDNGTAYEFDDALEATQGAKSTILDLRGNTGGFVNICTYMASQLLSQDDILVYSEEWSPANSTNPKVTQLYTSKDGIGKGRYYVLMLDSSSASCTELFAAAVTANLNSPIVGTNSFGKAIGQIYKTTDKKGICGITHSLYFDKNKQTYHTLGFVPDYYIPDSLEAIDKAVELAKEGTAKRSAGYGTETQPYWTKSKSLYKKGITINPEEDFRESLKGLAITQFE